jgi:hypothetical protein
MQMSGAAAYFGKNQQHSNIGENSSMQACRAVAAIFINDETFCKRRGKRKQRRIRTPLRNMSTWQKYAIATLYLVLIGGKCGNKKGAKISGIRWSFI